MGKLDKFIYGEAEGLQGSSNGGSIAPLKDYSSQTGKLHKRPTDSTFQSLLTDNQLDYWDFVKKKQLQFIPAPSLTLMASSKSSQIFTFDKMKFLHVNFVMDTVKRKKKK